ncbi:hypothetical protein [Actinomadura roseirufa]|uniref:hypothetical protein n=1 Tax=Actinomadura roseirufa TaxID=2094049 RepID=UPI001040F389|nr:hypothetical protein [Actinomadura roseirufa]
MAFHCYLWLGDTATAQGPKRDQLCGDLSMATPPVLTRDWLRKPQSMVQQKAATPEAAVSWLEKVFDQHAAKMAHSQATGISRDDRFGQALADLKSGTDLSWGFPLVGSKYLALAVIVVG